MYNAKTQYITQIYYSTPGPSQVGMCISPLSGFILPFPHSVLRTPQSESSTGLPSDRGLMAVGDDRAVLDHQQNVVAAVSTFYSWIPPFIFLFSMVEHRFSLQDPNLSDPCL